MSESRSGLVYGVAAYACWGTVPVYWKLLDSVSPVEVVAHRVLWGIVALVAIVAATGKATAVRIALTDRRTIAMMALSGVLLTINWCVFVAAVATDHLLDASLGYFLNPLISIAFGTLVLRERLRRLQWIAIVLAVIGVAIQTWRAGHLPWISVAVSSTFGGYGVVRKLARVESLAGATIETALIVPLAASYLAILALRGGGELGHAGWGIHLLLASTGVVTVIPLLLFTSAARQLRLSTLGFLQYLGPVLQFALAVGVFGESWSREQLVAFSFIWAALAVFSLDLVRQSPRPRLSRTGP